MSDNFSDLSRVSLFLCRKHLGALALWCGKHAVPMPTVEVERGRVDGELCPGDHLVPHEDTCFLCAIDRNKSFNDRLREATQGIVRVGEQEAPPKLKDRRLGSNDLSRPGILRRQENQASTEDLPGMVGDCVRAPIGLDPTFRANREGLNNWERPLPEPFGRQAW